MTYRRLGFAVIIWGMSACHTWTHAATPEDAIARAGTATIRVTKTDHSVVLVQSPKIAQDSLTGMSVDGKQQHVAIPMGEVTAVSTQEVSLWRSAGAGYLTVLAALGIALAVISVSILAVK